MQWHIFPRLSLLVTPVQLTRSNFFQEKTRVPLGGRAVDSLHDDCRATCTDLQQAVACQLDDVARRFEKAKQPANSRRRDVAIEVGDRSIRFSVNLWVLLDRKQEVNHAYRIRKTAQDRIIHVAD
jgi:hypothetical protein